MSIMSDLYCPNCGDSMKYLSYKDIDEDKDWQPDYYWHLKNLLKMEGGLIRAFRCTGGMCDCTILVHEQDDLYQRLSH